MSTEPVLFYRYYASPVFSGDDTYTYLSKVVFNLEVYESVKKTPKGNWVVPLGQTDNPLAHRRFILDVARKKYAHPSKDAAWESLRRRNSARIRHLKRDLLAANAISSEMEAPAFNAPVPVNAMMSLKG